VRWILNGGIKSLTFVQNGNTYYDFDAQRFYNLMHQNCDSFVRELCAVAFEGQNPYDSPSTETNEVESSDDDDEVEELDLTLLIGGSHDEHIR